MLAPAPKTRPRGKRLGRGRSGEVWLSTDPDGRKVATKIFHGDTLSNLVHYVFTGAPNPYIWNEDAVRAAYERRKVLSLLLPAWLGERVTVSDAYDVSWNEETRSWQLGCAFCPGRPVPLLQPFLPRDDNLRALRHDVMRPLQRHLIDSGLDGVVWQAGLGNPVGLSNFLMTRAGDDEAPGEFALIDAESGVPALFPANPWRLLTFYLPRCWKFGRAMFDDVDVPKLRSYVDREADTLRQALGEERLAELRGHIDRLGHHQERWRAFSRSESAMAYQVAKGRLTEAQAAHYRDRPFAWKWREARRGVPKMLRLSFVRAPRRFGRWLGSWDLRAMARNSWKFITSQEYRTDLGRDYTLSRIGAWQKRGQLSDEQADELRQQVEDERADASSTYLTDFGAHLGIKATFQVLEFTVVAALVAAGVIPIWFVAIIIALDGLIYRSAYTLYRMARNALRRQPLPWIALLIGFFPLVGSLAFPAQMIWAANERRDRVARFLVYDTFTRIGGKIPIWGGDDTLTEQFFNRIGGSVARFAKKADHVPAEEPATA